MSKLIKNYLLCEEQLMDIFVEMAQRNLVLEYFKKYVGWKYAKC